MIPAPLRRFGALALCALTLGPALRAGPKIGVLLKGRSDFWTAMQKGAQEAGAQAGAEVLVKAPLSETDVAVQEQLLHALAAQGIQALVIAPTNPQMLAGPVAALAAKGVKIVAVDTPLKGAAAFIGTNHRAAGEAAGTFLAGLVGDKDEISFLKHNQNSGATGERENGALDKLRAAHPGVVVHGDIYASTEAGLEAERAALVLGKYPASKAVLASGTPGTMAMLKVLSGRPAGAVRFVGFGFNLNPAVAEGIGKGVMAAWIAQQPREVGAKGVEAALALVGGQAVPAVTYTDFVVVTKDNLQDPKVQALLQ